MESRHQKLLAEAREMLRQSEDETENLRLAVTALEKAIGHKDAGGADRPTQSTHAGRAHREGPPFYGGMSTPAVIEQILRAAGKPLKVDEILDEMKRSGFSSKDEIKLRRNIWSALVRQKNRFRKTKPGTFTVQPGRQPDLLDMVGGQGQ